MMLGMMNKVKDHLNVKCTIDTRIYTRKKPLINDLRHKKPRVMATTDHQLQYNKNIVTTLDSNELSTRITIVMCV